MKEEFNDFCCNLQSTQDTGGGYRRMLGDNPFAKRYNELQGDYWVRTGREIDSGDLILEILIRDYNNKHEN